MPFIFLNMILILMSCPHSTYIDPGTNDFLSQVLRWKLQYPHAQGK